MVELFKSIGDENRLRIINLLSQGEFCVCEIEVLLEMTQSNASKHLKKLKNVGWISSSKEAQWIHYRLNDEFIKSNHLLYDYLREQFQKTLIYNHDLRRYLKYKDKKLNCKWIAEDKDKVLNLIK